jgi:cupin fold WbuC family metalloprotein
MNNLPLKKLSDEVYLATDDIVRLDQRAVEFIKQQAIASPRKRARICAHKSPDDTLHEMVIAILAESYIRPHRHHGKIESFHLIEGRADIVILNEEGEIVDVVKLGGEHCFYYRLNTPYYHTLIIHSPILVIHEITNGPFDVKASDFASFSPEDHHQADSVNYINHLKQKISAHAAS